MPPKPEHRQLAKDLYLHTGKTQQEIADILDVNRRTIYLWIKHGKWEEMKIAARQAPSIILQDIYNHIDAVNTNINSRDPGDRCPTMEEVDKLRKLLKMTKDIHMRHAGAYMEAFEELIIYIVREDRELGESVMSYADNYIKGNFGDRNFHSKKNRDANITMVKENLAQCEAEELKDNPDADQFPNKKTIPIPCPLDDENGIQCDTDAITDEDDETTPQPAPTASYDETTNENLQIQYPTENFSENATTDEQKQLNSTPVTGRNEATTPITARNEVDKCRHLGAASRNVSPLNSHPAGNEATTPVTARNEVDKCRHFGAASRNASPLNSCSCEEGNNPNSQSQIPNSQTIEYILSLSPELRPSPFRDGNIIWVINKEDVNENDLKMSDSVRFYPDIDPLAKQNRAAYEMRIKSETPAIEQQHNKIV